MMNDLLATLPLGIVVLMGCLVLLVGVFSKGTDRRFLGYMTAFGMVAALGSIYLLWGADNPGLSQVYFAKMMAMGRFELMACALLLLIGLCVTLIAIEHAGPEGFDYGEFYALINFAVFGMMVLVTATNLVTLFVGLEIMSVSVYVLAAIKRKSHFSAEAGLKYFVLGAFATGLLVYGLAFLYGETSSLSLPEIGATLSAVVSSGSEPSGYLTLALLLITGAFGFKIALVPFHMWTPDVYEGAPPPVAALMATGVKTAAVLAFGRILILALPSNALGWMGPDFFHVMGVIAVATMTLGNVVAIAQNNLKRMLAYSSIAHAGYILIGLMAAHVAAGTDPAAGGQAMSAVLFYLFVYSLANLAAFGVLTLMTTGRDEDVTHNHIAGLSRSRPLMALALAAAMFSLAGIPPLAGFFGKLSLFREALTVDSDRFMWLVIFAVLNSVVSVFYYLKVVVYAYMRDPVHEAPKANYASLAVALAISVVLSIQAGIFPNRYMKMADRGGSDFVDAATQQVVPPKKVSQAGDTATEVDERKNDSKVASTTH